MTTCSCGRDFITSPTLFVHQRVSGHCFCKLCNRQFDSEPSLASHNKADHSGSSSGSQQGKKSPPQLPQAKKSPPKLPQAEKRAKSWVCPWCDKSFSDQGPANDHCSYAHPHKCGACSKAYTNLKLLHNHKRQSGHCFCRQCKQFFPDNSALVEHRRVFIHASGFHCCDCDRDFKTQQALDQHLQFKDHTSIKKVHGPTECTECQREFPNQAALKKHQASVVHNPLSDLKCIASAKCKQEFHSPSALLHHLESGRCHSGLTRRELNRLVQKNDTDRLISSHPIERDITEELQDRLSSLTLTSHAVPTPISSEDSTPIMTPVSENGSGVPLSPYLENMSPALSPTDISAIQIRSGPQKIGLFCPLCPQRPKPFSTLAGLEMHLASSKHAPKVFHCPAILFPPTKGKGNHPGSTKHFSSLSGLAQHLESGACRGGKATLQKAAELLQDHLKDLGAGPIRLLN